MRTGRARTIADFAGTALASGNFRITVAAFPLHAMLPVKPLKLLLLGFFVLSLADLPHGRALAAVRNQAEAAGRRMIVEPSSTTVAKGKVSLTVQPLTRKGDFFVGSYQIKVVPYFFKSEKGGLKLKATDETVAKLKGGQPVEFTGTATNAKNGKVKVVTGHATPSDNDEGDVTVSVQTENGQMEFETTYQLK